MASSGEVAYCNQLRIGRRLQPIRGLNERGMNTVQVCEEDKSNWKTDI